MLHDMGEKYVVHNTKKKKISHFMYNMKHHFHDLDIFYEAYVHFMERTIPICGWNRYIYL